MAYVAPMRLLYITSEMAPFAKTGGLADVLGALPAQLQRLGHDVRVFVPAYASIDRSKYPLSPASDLETLDLHLGPHRYRINYATAKQPHTGLTVHFVHCPALFGRQGIYSSDPDEHLRFLALSYAALEACRQQRWAPDLVHCNDWQTGLVPLALKTIYARDPVLGRAKSLLTIHNLQYQGRFPAFTIADTRLHAFAGLFHQDQLRDGVLNYLLHGVLYADGITTVSPTYSREIPVSYTHLDVYKRQARYPDRFLCLEVRRDLLVEAYTPFVQMKVRPDAALRIAAPVAKRIGEWLRERS